ncbi:protein THEM6-like [Contarinia nasturtii]|uniref:protein THEM6-like n=1 Tax=Contarinia nasturtii TaxID=265458 RepID=UPI0012D4A85E|nr:protein THEM6-like [Contarinia nasturtii]XP_031632970.1 protein THEM6-like [Contarinia nasturtii]XP_031632971.1 protein THEM6-like [Contarinia nasturtii]
MGFGLILLLILYIIWDVNYFIRCVFTVAMGRLFQSKRKITETTTIYGLCTTQDVDIFIRHMNNARYVRELDFARFHFYGLTGLYEGVRKNKGGAVQGASSVRYRKTIPIFSPYKVETKLIWWDEKAIYLEQKFITFDGFVRAIAMSKQCITNCNVVELLKGFQGGEKIPDPPQELQLWLNAIEVSSEKLRKDKKSS